MKCRRYQGFISKIATFYQLMRLPVHWCLNWKPCVNSKTRTNVSSSWWPIWALQRLVELVSVRTAEEHQTRRPLPLLVEAGFEIVESERLRAGTVERVLARKH